MISPKEFKKVRPGDVLWWCGQRVQIIKAVVPRGDVLCLRAEFISGPLKGTLCHITGLSYGFAQVEVPEAGLNVLQSPKGIPATKEAE